jgi:hypothetical protein
MRPFLKSWLLTAVISLAFVLLWLDLFFLPASPVSPVLDPSWCGAMVHFAALKLQFGKDVIFTYGPLAHLISFVYTGELFTTRVVWEFLSKGVFASILCITLLRLPKASKLVFYFFILLLIWIDPIVDALYFLIFVCLAGILFRDRHRGMSAIAAAGVLLGVCSLIKFTYFILAILAIVAVAGFYAAERKPTRAITLVASFICALGLAWHLAGQSLAVFPAYLVSSTEVAFGYKEAMGIPADSNWIVVAGVIALLCGLIQCGLAILHSRRVPALCVALFFAGAISLSWTRAFVRADDHVLSFFAFLPLASLVLWIPIQLTGAIKRIGFAMSVSGLLASLAGMALQKPMPLTASIPEAISRVRHNFEVVTHLQNTTRQLEAGLLEARSAYDLPRVRAEVKNETIDLFGYEQGIVLLNRFNYTPRPIFQGYSAYTPRLITANTAFYSSPHAPTYVLLKYQAIDERYPSSEDAGVLLQLLLNYTPLFDENGYSLWKRIRDPEPLSPHTISTRSLLINEICDLPAGKNVWVQLDLAPSIRGWLRGLFYKPPRLEIRTNDSDGEQFVHRLIPSMSRVGFIINPRLESSRDLLTSAVGGKTSSVVSFLLDVDHPSRRFFQRRASCQLAVLPEWGTRPKDKRARHILYQALFGEQSSQVELAEFFKSASKTLFVANADSFALFSALHEATLSIGKDGLEIAASGSDPQLSLPKIGLSEGKRAVLRLDLTVPADTGVQLFYLPPGATTYNQYHMDAFARRGKNTIYFELSNRELAEGSWRLDPGMAAGKYVITGFELRLIEETQ